MLRSAPDAGAIGMTGAEAAIVNAVPHHSEFLIFRITLNKRL